MKLLSLMSTSVCNCFVEKKASKLGRFDVLKEIYKYPDRKPVLKIIGEIIYLSFLNRKFPPRYYTARYLFKKDVNNILDYCSDDFFCKVNQKLNENGARDVLENKLFFSLYYSQLGVAIPKLLGYNHNRKFMIDGKIYTIRNQDDFRKFLEQLSERIPDNDSMFIKKTWGTFGGDRVFKLLKNQISCDPDCIKELYDHVIDSEYIYQERLIQHPLMDKLNPSCVNTIRIDTFIDKEGNADVMSAYLRTSFSGHHVDNISSGGCEIPVDVETGRLNKFGYMEIEDYGVRLPEFHPVSKVNFEDFVIPYFDELRKFVCHVAELMPKLRLIGWDVAIGPTGPVLIEGNSFYDMSGSDLSYGGYGRNPVFRKALMEIGLRSA